MEEWLLPLVLARLPASQCQGAVRASRAWRAQLRAQFAGTLREARARATLESVSRFGYIGGSVALRMYLSMPPLSAPAWRCGPPNVYLVEQRDIAHFSANVHAMARALARALDARVGSVQPVWRKDATAASWPALLEDRLWAQEDASASAHGLYNVTWSAELAVGPLRVRVVGARLAAAVVRSHFDLSVCRILLRVVEQRPLFWLEPACEADIRAGVMRGWASPERVLKYTRRGFAHASYPVNTASTAYR